MADQAAAELAGVSNATDLSPVLGPVIMGQVATVLFYGILLSVFTRFLTSSAWRRATFLLKAIILVVVGLASVSTSLAIHDLWHYACLVTDDIAVVLSGSMPQAVEPLISGLTGFTVQVVLVLRVAKIISKPSLRWSFIAVILVGALLSLIAACFFAAYLRISYHKGSFSTVQSRIRLEWNQLFEWWLFSSAAVDLVITVIYIFALRKRLGGRSETSDSVLRLIVICAVRCAAYTTIVATVGAILAPIYPSDGSFYTYAFWEPLAVLYALSLFTTLGVADSITAKLSDPNLRRVSGMGTYRSSGSSAGGGKSALPQFFLSRPGTREEGGLAGGVELYSPPSQLSQDPQQPRRSEDLDIDGDKDLQPSRSDTTDGLSSAENGVASAAPSRPGLGRSLSGLSVISGLSARLSTASKAGQGPAGGIMVEVETVQVEEKDLDGEELREKRSY